MKQFKDKVIIGIDHGYGIIKTANHIFNTGVTVSDTEPVFGTNVLFYNGKYYLIGEGHKEYSADKITDEEYFILTLAIIAYDEKRQNEQLVETILTAVRSALSNVQLASPSVQIQNSEVTDKDADAASVSNYAQNAVIWAVASGIISGTSQTTLSPGKSATRAEIATMLMRCDMRPGGDSRP
ncbi:MAG: S-layer homology domain-containing protein [Clostridia bacterium]|nr:S-layer homology domain-containing protein [Clostridia bacterium]